MHAWSLPRYQCGRVERAPGELLGSHKWQAAWASISSSIMPPLKSQVPEDWAGLLGQQVLTRLCALFFCIMLARIQQCGFLWLLLSRQPWLFSLWFGWVFRKVREGGAAVRSRWYCSYPVFMPHTRDRKYCSRDSAFFADHMEFGKWKPTRTPAPVLLPHLIHVLLSTRVVMSSSDLDPAEGPRSFWCGLSPGHTAAEPTSVPESWGRCLDAKHIESVKPNT